MNASLALTSQGEETWLNLRYHVEWAERFALILLFSSNRALHNLLCERLAAIYRTRVSHLQRLTPNSASTLVEDVLALIRTPPELYEHAAAPLWLDLSMARDENWDRDCSTLLARLNEHRELLRQRLCRPVILALPADYAQRFRELAPDLWSIRDFSLNLDEVELAKLPVESDDANGAAVLSSAMYDKELRTRAAPTPTFFDEAQWREWERLKQSNAKSREVLWAGWRAMDAALEAKQLQRAEQVADDVLKLARELGANAGDTPETIRDLAISLERIGDIARAQARLDAADRAYQESLDLRRRQRERLGDTPETIRDLAIALMNVGNTAEARRQRHEATAWLQEALLLWRRLNLAFPDSEEYQEAIADLEQRLTAL